ncbi:MULTISPECIES: DUF6083 domain-containing protein [Streptomyces]|uniref:DUF6083 domain-containing protein n=1 Tax=Streptomyces TaxID=1883 RepID=UPI000B9EB902|nr:DUF6083 domain-containing protein [Streptomyces kasugaensis]
MSIHLHRSNTTRLLRSKAQGVCAYCSCPVEWFDRYDERRIPLMPGEFPLKHIPPRYRWYVDGGVAYAGTLRGYRYCRLAHTAICPALDHDDLDEILRPLVTKLGARMQNKINAGEFTPRAVESHDPGAVAEPEPANAARAGQVRHTIRYANTLRLAPGRIEDLQCTATADDEERCTETVYSLSSLADGHWVRTEIPYAAGREGEQILNVTGGMMWVWSLDSVDFQAVKRWLTQRCDLHAGTSAPDHSPREWVGFDPVRHAAFILGHKPEGYPEPGPAVPDVRVYHEPRKTRCAGVGCSNGTTATVPDGWLCDACERRRKRRADVHARWQKGGTSGAGSCG